MIATTTGNYFENAGSRRESASGAVWTGRILTGLAAAFMLFDAGIKLVKAQAAIDGTVALGYRPDVIVGIGLVALICTILYLIPRTAPLGAILWTGYLGGAVASNVRVDNPLFSQTLFPIYFAAILWTGLYLRDRRVQALIEK